MPALRLSPDLRDEIELVDDVPPAVLVDAKDGAGWLERRGTRVELPSDSQHFRWLGSDARLETNAREASQDYNGYDDGDYKFWVHHPAPHIGIGALARLGDARPGPAPRAGQTLAL